jgi:putative transposase
MASSVLNDDSGFETRDWFTAAELAELALPGLPADKRSINRRAQDDRWTTRRDGKGGALVRPRTGRGGGVEFHVSLLPPEARLELARRGLSAPAPMAIVETPGAAGWRWLEAQPERVRAEAQRRLTIVGEIELLEEAGMTRTAAIAATSARHARAAKATLWEWLRAIEGVGRADRLPALAPRHKGGGKRAEIDPFLWDLFKADWLRPECPTLTSCYDRTAAKAAEMGLSMPSEKAFRRRSAEIDPRVVRLARGGREKAERAIPANRRTVEASHALEMINVDGHQFDVFVTPPGSDKPVRPVMIAIQDVFSRKLLAWRLDLSENYLATRLAFADLFERFGIPGTCYLDNSRTFAGKALTGGARTRFRNKFREEEAAGLLVSLGVNVRFTQVYHGQSKPIERAFRDLADRVARHPACAGAYTGNSPMRKPANYGKRAVPWTEFETIVAQGIADHNARLGRRTETARGRSFDQAFAESYATSTVRKAAPEQLRMALLAAEQKRVNRTTGEIELYGNRYWADECGRFLGDLVTVRFDPDNLHREVHVYAAKDGRYLATAELIQDYGFADAAGAIAAKKRRKLSMAAVRAGLEAERLMSAEAVAAHQVRVSEPEIPATSVIRAVRPQFTAGRSSAALKLAPNPHAEANRERETRVFAALRAVGDEE